MTSPSVHHAEIESWPGVEGAEHHGQRRSTCFEAGDLAVVIACLDPDAVFVRQQGGTATSIMRREADGAWYFVD
jgi:ketosteroid isomerase-like protein